MTFEDKFILIEIICMIVIVSALAFGEGFSNKDET